MKNTDVVQNLPFIEQLTWNQDGLIPVIAQDAESGKLLMMAWMNREALGLTVKEGRAVYWSRSRKALWWKGEQSGHVQNVREIRIDCDEDVILLKVDQVGGIACHTGRESCFYRILKDGEWQTVEPIVKNPENIYK